MDRLPQELAVEILSRLPLLTLLRSKSVCRAWRILIQDQLFPNRHFKHMVDDDPTFILQIKNQLYFGDLLSGDGNTTMFTKKLPMPPLHHFYLEGTSCNGLLCLRGTHLGFQLGIYNPFTTDYMELPNLGHRPGVIGFGFDPSTNKYKIVEISYKTTFRGYHRRVVRRPSMLRASPIAPSSSTIESNVHILTVGSPTWRSLGSFPFHLLWQASQVSVNDKLHWINANLMTIMSFDLVAEQFKEVPRPEFISPEKRFHELMVLRGCLSAVSFDEDTKELEIWVMKEYDVKESWVKDFSIGAYVPKTLQPNDERRSRAYLHKRWIRVLCQLRSGGILLQYRNKAIVIYDPNCMTFQDIQVTLEEIPRCFKIVAHVASLNWTNTILHA